MDEERERMKIVQTNRRQTESFVFGLSLLLLLNKHVELEEE